MALVSSTTKMNPKKDHWKECVSIKEPVKSYMVHCQGEDYVDELLSDTLVVDCISEQSRFAMTVYNSSKAKLYYLQSLLFDDRVGGVTSLRWYFGDKHMNIRDSMLTPLDENNGVKFLEEEGEVFCRIIGSLVNLRTIDLSFNRTLPEHALLILEKMLNAIAGTGIVYKEVKVRCGGTYKLYPTIQNFLLKDRCTILHMPCYVGKDEHLDEIESSFEKILPSLTNVREVYTRQ